MDMNWIYEIPSLALGLEINAVFLFASLTALIATRNAIAKHFQKSHESDQSVSAIFGGVGTLYGLLLGLVAVAAWQNYDKLNDLVDEEASSIVQLYRSVSVLKDPSHKAILEEIKTYTRNIIEISWPAHQKGMTVTSTGTDLISSLYKKLGNYELKSKDQPASYAQAVASLSEMVKARRMRINGNDIAIPGALWVVILGGAVLTIPITFFFHLPSLRTHLLLTGFYVFFLSGIIALIAILDTPMRGEISVSSEPYQKALEAMERIELEQ